MPKGAALIIDTHDFTERALARIGWSTNPLDDGTLEEFNVHALDLTELTLEALKDLELSRKDAGRSKNMFALGLLSWMYSRPTEGTLELHRDQVRQQARHRRREHRPRSRPATHFGETTEAFAVSYEIKPAALPQRPRTATSPGNLALAYGLIAASQRSGLPLFLGAYPITPASDILHELSKHKRFGVRTFQAEDEIAGIGAALGAAFGGALAVTTSSGPGIALKGETIGLAVSLELPLIICDIQRGGPSTGLPTKTEQSDLLQAMYGRNGEAPVPIVAAQSPGDCFDAAIEAARIALTYRTPVFLLSDGYLANGSEPWLVPSCGRAARPVRRVRHRAERRPNGEFLPYLRDPETLARPWAVPGTAGLEHRVGGIEKADKTGNISYDPDNHDFMVRTRQAKVDGIARSLPPMEVDDPDGRRQGARARLGFDLRPDRGGLPQVRASGALDRAGAPASPQPVPVRPGRRPGPLRAGRDPGDEPRPARHADPRPSTWSTR